MKKLSLLSLFLFIALFSFAEEQIYTGTAANTHVKGANIVRYTDESLLPNYIGFAKGSELPLALFEKWMHGTLQLNASYSLVELNRFDDQIGFTHIRLQENFKGIPVKGTMWILHLRNGVIQSMNGTLYNQINSGTNPAITEQVALNLALTKVDANQYKWQIPQEEQQLKIEQNNPNATYYPKGELMIVRNNGVFHLCYAFSIYAQQPFGKTTELIDAFSGQVIESINEIKTIGVTGTAHTKYSGVQTIKTDSLAPTSFRLRESTRGNGIFTYNSATTTGYPSTDFTDTNNNWNNINGNQDEVATDAHWGAEMTYDFYNTNYSRNSIDNNGFALLSYVHYDVGMVNAFWDGQRMSYGDGDASTPPLTALDITGHEITHGLTTFTCNLNGGNEPGALNEGFSDIAGKSIEKWARPGNSNWQIGADINMIIRDMANPNATQNPDTYQGTNWDFVTQEVHKNSTVLSHWFYLLTMGGSGTNDINNSYNVTGQGYTKANAIAFRDQTVYLFPASQYSDARFYALQAAVDLYGPCSPEVQATADAWYAVGVGTPYSPTVTAAFTSSSSIGCSAPLAVQFHNLSINSNVFAWDFGDGSPINTSNSPLHIYNSNGTFSVTLIVSGGACGSDTISMPNYLVINPGLPCTNLPANGQTVTETMCSGNLYDDAGNNADYSSNYSSYLTIAPTGAQQVSMQFTLFDTEQGYDSLYLYDGPTSSSPLIGAWSGTALPNGGAIIYSSGGSLTVHFVSDPSVVGAGFEANWQCISNQPPVAIFSADNVNSCSGLIHFNNSSSGAPTAWHWDFGDGTTDSIKTPTHTYSTNGTYSVELIVTNAFGIDTLLYTNYITVNHPSPGPSGINGSTCSSGQVALGATPNGAGNTINWYSSASSSTILGSGNTFFTPSISTTTTYYAEEIIPGPIDSLGPVNNSIGTGNNYTNNNDRYLVFNCTAASTLVSVKVISGTSGPRTIQLRNSAGTVLQSAVVTIPSGTSTVTLNFALPIANGLQLGLLSGGTAHNLYRNNGGAVYPYTNGPVSITGVNPGSPSNYYYFFYNWKIQTGNCATVRTPVVATTGAISAAATLSGSSTICSNDSAMLTAVSSSSYTYQWNNNGNPIPGATQSTYQATAAGNYTCTISATGCAPATSAPAINISTIPSPTSAIIQPSTDTASRCLGTPFVIKAFTSAGYSYQWYRNANPITGGTTDTFLVINGGGLFTNLYTVSVTANGCTATSPVFTLLSYTAPTAVINPNATQTICPGQSITLNANTGINYAYQWDNGGTPVSGATAASFTTATPGNYSVTIDNTYCPTSTSTAVSVVASTLQANFTSVAGTNGLINFTDGSAGTPSSWNWTFGDNASSTIQNPSHTYSASGNYTVTLIVADASGCSDTIMKDLTVDITGIANVNSSLSIVLFPNPASTTLQVNLKANAWNGQTINGRIINALGQEIQTVQFTKEHPQIAIQSLAKGAYMLQLQYGKQLINKSFIKE